MSRIEYCKTENDVEYIYVIKGVGDVKTSVEFSTSNFGRFKDFNRALEIVVNNSTDLYEFINKYIVISKQSLEGLYLTAIAEYWFKFNEDENKYESCEKPKELGQWIF